MRRLFVILGVMMVIGLFAKDSVTLNYGMGFRDRSYFVIEQDQSGDIDAITMELGAFYYRGFLGITGNTNHLSWGMKVSSPGSGMWQPTTGITFPMITQAYIGLNILGSYGGITMGRFPYKGNVILDNYFYREDNYGRYDLGTINYYRDSRFGAIEGMLMNVNLLFVGMDVMINTASFGSGVRWTNTDTTYNRNIYNLILKPYLQFGETQLYPLVLFGFNRSSNGRGTNTYMPIEFGLGADINMGVLHWALSGYFTHINDDVINYEVTEFGGGSNMYLKIWNVKLGADMSYEYLTTPDFAGDASIHSIYFAPYFSLSLSNGLEITPRLRYYFYNNNNIPAVVLFPNDDCEQEIVMEIDFVYTGATNLIKNE